MDELPAGAPVVRSSGASRLAAAAHAVAAQLERLEQVVGQRPEILAHLHAGNALRADDDHGRARDLVVQADELRWSELVELARLASAQLDADVHGGTGRWHRDCPACQAAVAIARVRAHQQQRTVGPAEARSSDPAGTSSAPAPHRP